MAEFEMRGEHGQELILESRPGWVRMVVDQQWPAAIAYFESLAYPLLVEWEGDDGDG